MTEWMLALTHVRFANRPFESSAFHNRHEYRVDVARGSPRQSNCSRRSRLIHRRLRYARSEGRETRATTFIPTQTIRSENQGRARRARTPQDSGGAGKAKLVFVVILSAIAAESAHAKNSSIRPLN